VREGVYESGIYAGLPAKKKKDIVQRAKDGV
jgi:hypothetical protein